MHEDYPIDAEEAQAAMRQLADSLRDGYGKHGDKVRFLLIGSWNTLFGYIIFLVLLAILTPPLQSLASSPAQIAASLGEHSYVVIQWMAWVLSVPPNTLAMKHFVFREKGSSTRYILRAYLVYLPAQCLTSLILLLTVRLLQLKPSIGALVALAVVTIFSYVGHKYFTFKSPAGKGNDL